MARFRVAALEMEEKVKFEYNILKVEPSGFHWKWVAKKSEESKMTPRCGLEQTKGCAQLYGEVWERDQEFSVNYNKLEMPISIPCGEVKKTIRYSGLHFKGRGPGWREKCGDHEHIHAI